MPTYVDNPVSENLSRHLRILGICWILYGILRLITALWLVLFANTATVMFGALLTRVNDPFALMGDFHFIYTFMIVLSAVCGVCGILGGGALLAGRRFGRPLAIIAAFLSISSIPLGTTLGIYSLIVLLPISDGRSSTAILDARSSHLKGHAIAT